MWATVNTQSSRTELQNTCVNISCILRPYVIVIICSLSFRAQVLREYIHILLLYNFSLFSLFLKFIVYQDEYPYSIFAFPKQCFPAVVNSRNPFSMLTHPNQKPSRNTTNDGQQHHGVSSCGASHVIIFEPSSDMAGFFRNVHLAFRY